MRIVLATIGATIFLSGIAHAQQSQPAPASDQDYMQQVLKAAPQQVGEQATIIRMHKGEMRTVKKGTNEFTCMIVNEGEPGTAPMCMDPNAVEWAHALVSHAPPPR